MNSKVIEIKTQKVELELTQQERSAFLHILSQVDSIYHSTLCDSCEDTKIIQNLWSAMNDFKKRYIKGNVVCC